MTEIEIELQRIMASIAKHNVPIVFKGAMVLNTILSNQEYIRTTQDIDGSTKIKEVDKIVELINVALKEDNLNYYFEVYRYPTNVKSIGFYIYHSDGKIFSQMDLDNKEYFAEVTYSTNQGNFVGVSIEQTLANKVYVLSTRKVFRRIKDLYDVYRIGKCLTFSINDIFLMQDKIGVPFENFENLLYRIDDVKNAYSKFIGIQNKPDFNEIYDFVVKKFIPPFINNERNLKWDNKQEKWIKI